MKNFFDKVKNRLEEGKLAKINLDENEKLSNEEEKIIKEEWRKENQKELQSLLITGSVMFLVLLIFCSLVFVFRKNIMKKFNKFTEDLIEIGDKAIKDQELIDSKEENQTSSSSNSSEDSSLNEKEKINCQKFFNGTFTKSSNNQTESLTLASDGSYSRVYSNNSTSIGTYTIVNNKIILKEELFTGTSSNNFIYQLSKDCQKITNTKDTTNILKIE